MLIIHNINPTGAFSYGLCETQDLEKKGLINLKGVNLDSGGSNGAGKTSLFNTLCVLLFDRNPTGTKDNDIPNAVWKNGMAVRCEFTSWENIRYRITYCRDWKKELYAPDNDNKTSYVGTSLYFDKLENGSWYDIRSNSMKSTREKIQEAIGMTYEQFLSTSYMSHRVGSTFLRGSNKDRIDTLTGITGVAEWDKILDKSRLKKRELKSECDALERDISYLEGSKKEVDNQLTSLINVDWASQSKKIEEELTELRESYKVESNKLKELKKEVSELIIRRDSSYSADVVENINKSIEEKKKEIKTHEKEISRVGYSDCLDYEEFLKAKEAVQKVVSLKGSLQAMQGETPFLNMKNCPTCGARIDKSKKETISNKIKELEDHLKEAEREKKEASEVWEAIKSKVIDETSDKIEDLKISIESLQVTIQSELNSYHLIDSQLRDKNSAIENINMKLNYMKNIGEVKTKELSNLSENVNKVELLKSRLSDITQEIKVKRRDIDKICEDVQVYDWYISNIPYIKLHKLSVSMGELSNLINQILSDMGDTMRVDISSFDEKAKKKNAADVKDLLKSEIKVDIVDGDKRIDPRLYSDGEISKISNAFIRGLNELARKFGYGCNLMLLDEIFSFIDTNNSQKLVDSFKKDFSKKSTVFITDNSGISENLLTFDEDWIAKKASGKTVLEVTSR